MTFEQFDECVISWGRAKFGEKYIKVLWRNELLDLNEWDLEDELDKFKMEEHCDLVYPLPNTRTLWSALQSLRPESFN